MLVVVLQGTDYVFATHADYQRDEIAGLYAGGVLTGPNGEPAIVPAGEIVTVPNAFRFAYDELGRRKDPRRFAAEGETPVGA